MEVLPGPLPDGRRSGGDEGLGSRLSTCKPYGAHFRGWNKYAGTYPAKMSTVVLIFADGDFRLQASDFRDIYLNRIAEKVNQYLSGCVPVEEKYGT